MTQPTDFIEQLAALAEKATPGPWEEEYDPIGDGDHPTAVCLPGRAGLPGTFIAYFRHNWNDAYAGERRISWKEAETNAALIVLLRNSLPAILALGRENEAKDREIERLRRFAELVAERNDSWGDDARAALEGGSNEQG